MTGHELDPREFIGCGVSLAEWIQLDADERRPFVTARNDLLEQVAVLIVDRFADTVAAAAEEMKLHALVEKAAKEVGA